MLADNLFKIKILLNYFIRQYSLVPSRHTSMLIFFCPKNSCKTSLICVFHFF